MELRNRMDRAAAFYDSMAGNWGLPSEQQEDLRNYANTQSIPKNHFLPPPNVLDYINELKGRGLWNDNAVLVRPGETVKYHVNHHGNVFMHIGGGHGGGGRSILVGGPASHQYHPLLK